MTRKQRHQGFESGNITYNLSNPRNVAAFEALLEQDEEQEQQRPGRAKSSPKQKPKREKEKFFKLKDSDADQQQPGASINAGQSSDALSQLNELFGGAADPDVISDIFQACGRSFEATVKALLGMLGSAGASGPPGSSSSSAAASSSSAARNTANSSSAALSWEMLPSDVKQSILSQLPARDLARAAHTSREFHQRSSSLRRGVNRLVLPPGLGYSALAGMVRSHATATVIDLSRLERTPGSRSRQQQQQEARQARGQQQPLPQVVVMQKQEAEANLFKSVLAVAEAAAAAARQVPVKGLVLSGLAGATDRVLAEALQSLRGLRSLDLSHCPHLTNKSLYLVAKYQASEGLPGLQEDEEEDEEEEEEVEDGDEQAAEEDEEATAAAGDWSDSDASESFDGTSSSSSVQERDSGDDDEAGVEDAAAAAAEVLTQQEQQEQQHAGAEDEPWPDPEQLEDFVLQQTAAPTELTPQPSSSSNAGAASASGAAEGFERNPAVHSPAQTALTAAVADRMAALQLRSTQQAAAAAAAAAAAVARAAGLQELRLCGNKALADDGLRQVLQGPVTKHSLVALDVSRCGFSEKGLIVPPLGVLRELRASHCKALTQLVIHLPASHPLALLDLSGCHYLRVVDLHLRSLHQLNLSACRTLYRLRMRCPALKSLSLAQCGMLRDFHTDAWQVPALQQLNLFGCRRAAGSMLQPVLDQLPELRWISLNGCWAIGTLHLTANLHLQSLDITGCRNLVAVSSSSAALRELQAASCSRMSSLTLASSQLRTLTLTNCSQLSEVHTGAAAAAAAAPLGAASEAGSSVDGSSKGARSALSVNGCSRLSPAAKARLAAAMAK